jgi:hypothetical protein
MTVRLSIYMVNQICREGPKCASIISKWKKRKSREKLSKERRPQGDNNNSSSRECNNKELIHSEIHLEWAQVSSTISFQAHLSLWDLDLKLDMVRFREAHRDLEIPSVKTTS